DTHAGAFDDLGGHVGEAGAPVHAAFQCDVALLHGIDAGGQQVIDVEGCLVAANDDDLHPAGIENDGEPRVVAYATVHRAAVQVYPVEYELDPPGDRQRGALFLECRHGNLAADFQRDVGAHPCRRRLACRLRIAYGIEGHVVEFLAQDFGQDGGGVLGAARTGVVDVVEQDHGPLFDALGPRNGRLERFAVKHPLFARLPGGLQQFVAVALGCGGVCVGADNGAEAGFADIGVWKPYEHGRGQYALGFECAAAVLQGFVGIGVCSLAHDVGQHGFVGPRHDRADFALDRA